MAFETWSLREREGYNTPSFEEFLWYHVMPGGTYRTLSSDDPEDLQYYVASGLVWFAGIAYAADAAAAAAALGQTNVAAEWRLAKAVTYARVMPVAVMAMLAAAPAVAAGAYVGVQAVEESGIIQQTLDISQGKPSKPWWMPLAVYHALYS